MCVANISGPGVELRSRKGQTEVHITDPIMKKNNLRDVFSSISYLIHYWMEGEVQKVKRHDLWCMSVCDK